MTDWKPGDPVTQACGHYKSGPVLAGDTVCRICWRDRAVVLDAELMAAKKWAESVERDSSERLGRLRVETLVNLEHAARKELGEWRVKAEAAEQRFKTERDLVCVLRSAHEAERAEVEAHNAELRAALKPLKNLRKSLGKGPPDQYIGGGVTHGMLEAAVSALASDGSAVAESESSGLFVKVTQVVREADKEFETGVGSSRHWVRDNFLPALERHGLKINGSAVAGVVRAAEGWESNYKNSHDIGWEWDKKLLKAVRRMREERGDGKR